MAPSATRPRNRHLALCPLLLGLAGCTSDVTGGGVLHLPALDAYDFYADSHVDAAMQAAVQVAASQWSEFTGVRITLHAGDKVCAEGCFTILEPSGAALNAATLEQGFIGYTTVGVLAVAAGMSQPEMQETVIHEFGHALGLVHHTGVVAVMNPAYLTAAHHVACDDVRQYFANRNRPVPSGLPPCTDAAGTLVDAGLAE